MHQDIMWPRAKEELYPLLMKQLEGLIDSAPLPLPVLSNAAALLWEALPDINWAGFYLSKKDTLYLGPFQGKVACTVIPVGCGVCGTAAQTRMIQVVKDVSQFPGHIVCDSASRSEIVIPLCKDDQLLGVLDIDSPSLARFDDADTVGLSDLAALLMDAVDWRGGLL